MRKAIRIDWKVIVQEDGFVPTTELYVDSKNAKDIISFIKNDKNRSKLKRIAYVVNLGLQNKDLYGPEKVSDKAKDMMAMKFKGKPNSRIYCKEFKQGKRRIVMIQLLANKGMQKVDTKLKNQLETYGEYDYEFE